MSLTVGPYYVRATDWPDSGVSVDLHPFWSIVESGVNASWGNDSEIRDSHPSVHKLRSG
jgi:hypothetical protein